MMQHNDRLIPDWPAPPQVNAFTTMRTASLDTLPNAPTCLNQVHGTDIVAADNLQPNTAADACFTHSKGVTCLIKTADCLPIFLCDRDGTAVTAIHAGWRGLAAGIIESSCEAMQIAPVQLMAWLGPAISQRAFEVGPEVRDAFIHNEHAADACFKAAARPHHYFADLYGLATQRLHRLGINAVFGGHWCTYSDSEHFYSYRRDGKDTGRMLSLIWLD